MEKEWFNPIVLLKPGLQKIMGHILNGLPVDIQQAIKKTNIRVIYDHRPGILATPVANLITKVIIIQDVYMAFLWSCSYATIAFNKMYYEKANLDQDVVTFNDREELPKVDLTLRWARSLIEKVTHWPDEAARPDKPDQWNEEATNLFQACVTYILLHEVGHLLLHSGSVEMLVANNRRSKNDNKLMLNAEFEADEFALEALIAYPTADDILLMKYLGASLAHLSNFYLRRGANISGGITHPDLDDRLRAVMQQVKLNKEADEIQFQAHLSVGLQLFLNLIGKPFIPPNLTQARYKTFADLEKHLFKLIKQMKRAVK
jgi:hypothetical protein